MIEILKCIWEFLVDYQTASIITFFALLFAIFVWHQSIAHRKKDKIIADFRHNEQKCFNVELMKKIESISPNDASDNLKEEVKIADEIIKNPTTADDFHLKGYAAQIDENYDKAIEYYQKAIELKHDYAAAYCNMGNVYAIGKKDYDKANECCKKTIKYKPDSVEAYYNMGLNYADKKDYNKAIENFNKAIKYKPDLVEAYYSMGKCYSDKKDFDKAIEYYQKAIELKHDYAEAYYNMGLVYEKKGDRKHCIDCIKKAAQHGNENAKKVMVLLNKVESL